MPFIYINGILIYRGLSWVCPIMLDHICSIKHETWLTMDWQISRGPTKTSCGTRWHSPLIRQDRGLWHFAWQMFDLPLDLRSFMDLCKFLSLTYPHIQWVQCISLLNMSDFLQPLQSWVVRRKLCHCIRRWPPELHSKQVKHQLDAIRTMWCGSWYK